MTILRLYHRTAGTHVRCRFFVGTRDGSLALAGEITLRPEEFEAFHRGDSIEFRTEPTAAPDTAWRADRPGQYWCRWPGLDWGVARYLGIFGGDEVWENGGRPPEVGPLAVPPSELLRG